MEIRLVGAVLLHIVGQTDRQTGACIMKLMVAFRSFKNGSIKGTFLPVHAMKAYMATGSTATLIFTLGTKCR